MSTPSDDEFDQSSVAFLERDFNQCFHQIRHHDAQTWQIAKFCFTAYSAVIATSIGLYQFSLKNDANLVPAAICLLSAGFLLGVFLFCLSIRHRVYFVLLSRYINEHRRHFLSQRPLGFRNEVGMYTDPTKPPYFNWRSSDAWLFCTIALLNGFAASAVSYFGTMSFFLAMSAGLGLFSLQLPPAVLYLRSRENKAGEHAAFGRDAPPVPSKERIPQWESSTTSTSDAPTHQ
jgi:hypothetical protein